MITLSYIIATRNRLPFLKITLENLMAGLQPDEEIVVVDGASTDDTVAYLQELFDTGKIHRFISEPDKNQAHGWNKAMLLAKGTLIKKIIDDDVFCYAAIRQCKTYMLNNPQVDVVISNDLGSSLSNYQQVDHYSRLPQFKQWAEGLTPSFTFGDVHMLVRRSSLAYIGLYNTSYIMMDWEYALRISYLKANIAYYTGYNALSVAHPQTITSQKNNSLITQQGKKAQQFYDYAGDSAAISNWSKLKIMAGKAIYRANQTGPNSNSPINADIQLIYSYYYQYINSLNNQASFTFIPGS
ncbi:glycosyltransferase [Mucilaginibacter phyllosphaerae]|uniref:Glycosyltransferase n=1 Tax=Mucilaginibacter phyllosphaerae TaxID=1812349 RepID=A0A4Y8AGF0_9SPHI|nr:glycosyltransferase [Mucilaginibacter phyllosphaerae]MBB3968549.1 glycosyltransferase involved in cell wall biosynthesis [Mucilaginibacter phyllosphaerae]TEW67810.1 glycosyltransferase [Mucilaginibacter phyllosphaerae]GGH15317.1 hypothetical protein GCM10007352_24020 [Mucilaginibacter phyllosphaerae]